VLAAGRVGAERARLLAAIERLPSYRGGTRMARGLERAAEALGREPDAARTVLLVTDGRTEDEPRCRRVAADLAALRARVVALGVGEEYNEDLLAELCSLTGGRPWSLDDPATLPSVFESELGSATRQVVADVQATLRTVRDVRLVSATRVYPSLADLDDSRTPLDLGSLESGDATAFILELDVPARPAARVRLAQLGLTYRVPGAGYRGEAPPLDLVAEFTADDALASAVDPEVMGYVQQRNVDGLVRQAAEQAKRDPARAAKTLQLARSITERLVNRPMTAALGRAQEELQQGGTLAPGTLKTIKLGARTQTMKVSSPDRDPDVPSEEEIRRLTGA
jgi:Ca-activated chloride channel family protein